MVVQCTVDTVTRGAGPADEGPIPGTIPYQASDCAQRGRALYSESEFAFWFREDRS